MKRNTIDILAVAYLAIITYTSLVPFDFTSTPQTVNRPTLLGVNITIAGLPDILTNLALYLPLGFLIRAALAKRNVTPVTAAVTTVFVATAVSYAIELTQSFTVTRTSSLADIACNLIGTAMGVLLYMPESIVARKLIPAVESDLKNRTTALALTAWAFVIIATALAPFDFTFDVSLLKSSIKSAEFVPFAKLDRLAGDSAAMWNLSLDYLVDIVLFAVLAVVFVRHARTITNQRAVTFIATITATSALAVAVTLAPIAVLSVNLDMTRLITRLLGAIPLAIYLTVQTPKQQTRSLDNQRRIITAALAASIAYVAARQLIPFQLDITNISNKLANIEWLPFHSYSLAKLPAAVADVLHKSFRFITVGALLAAHCLLAGHKLSQYRLFTFSLVSAAFVAILELAQLAIPNRVPATTDVILAAIFTYAGIHAGHFLHNIYRQKRIDVAAQQSQSRRDRATLNISIPPPSTSEPAPRDEIASPVESEVKSKMPQSD